MALAAIHFDPYLASPSEDPYPLYRQLRDEAPVLRCPAPFAGPGEEMWVLSRYDDVLAVLDDWEAFSSTGPQWEDRPALVTGSDPPVHKRLRDAVKPYFTPKVVQSLEALAARAASELLGRIVEQGGGDLAADYAWPLTLAVVGEWLGMTPAERREAQDWYFEAYRSSVERVEDIRSHTSSGEERLEAYVQQLAAQGSERSGLVRDLTALATEGSLSEGEAAMMVRAVFDAGVDAGAALIGNGLIALAEHPGQRAAFAQVAGDRPGVAAAVQELMRYDPALQGFGRRATRAVELHGELIPRDGRVWLLPGAANRDERRFEDPDRLDLSRRAQRNLTFGSGIHFCLGAPLVRLVARVGFPLLLEALPDFELSGPVERGRAVETRMPLGIPVTA